MTNSLLIINLNKFLHTRGLTKSANSDYNLKYILVRRGESDDVF